jgi:hypothetical protein
MKKILALTIAVLLVGLYSSAAFAKNLPTMSSMNKMQYKNMLKNYMSPINEGYGIGYTDSTYVTAKWHITSVRDLNMSEIKEIIKNSNATEWSQLRNQVKEALNSHGTTVTKGRIGIGKNTYILTEINVTNTTATANIREMPVYSSCKDQNMTVEKCESTATLVGSLSLTKKTSAIDAPGNEPKVWGGALNFNSTAYTFVTFVYPRSGKNE